MWHCRSPNTLRISGRVSIIHSQLPPTKSTAFETARSPCLKIRSWKVPRKNQYRLFKTPNQYDKQKFSLRERWVRSEKQRESRRKRWEWGSPGESGSWGSGEAEGMKEGGGGDWGPASREPLTPQEENLKMGWNPSGFTVCKHVGAEGEGERREEMSERMKCRRRGRQKSEITSCRQWSPMGGGSPAQLAGQGPQMYRRVHGDFFLLKRGGSAISVWEPLPQPKAPQPSPLAHILEASSLGFLEDPHLSSPCHPEHLHSAQMICCQGQN